MKDEIRSFVIDTFAVGTTPEGFTDETSFLDSGLLDSTGIMELVSFMEEQYGIAVEDEELVPENLDSVNRVSAYLERKGVSGS